MSEPTIVEEVQIVDYEKLIKARVQVRDVDGNLFYLDPARKQGEFILRVVPQPVSEETAEIPPEWVRPPKDTKPENVVDWGFPASEVGDEPIAEGKSPASEVETVEESPDEVG